MVYYLNSFNKISDEENKMLMQIGVSALISLVTTVIIGVVLYYQIDKISPKLKKADDKDASKMVPNATFYGMLVGVMVAMTIGLYFLIPMTGLMAAMS